MDLELIKHTTSYISESLESPRISNGLHCNRTQWSFWGGLTYVRQQIAPENIQSLGLKWSVPVECPLWLTRSGVFIESAVCGRCFLMERGNVLVELP